MFAAYVVSALLYGFAFNQVHRPAHNPSQLFLHIKVFCKTNANLRIELGQEIHIAVRPEIAPGGRTEQRKRLDVVPAAEFGDFVTGQFEVRMDHGAAQLWWDISLLKV
jgi:hypothetical protein